MILLAVTLAVITALFSVLLYCRKPRIRAQMDGYITVPTVEGGVPYAGNGLDFGKDIIGFIRGAYKKYGKMFRIKIFNKEIIVCLDRSLMDEYFTATEDTMSLYDILNRLFFANSFANEAGSLPRIIHLVKTTIAVRFDEFMPKIMQEASVMIDRLKQKCAQGTTQIKLDAEMIRFVAFTSARCFIGVELSDKVYAYFSRFTKIVNFAVKLTYFAPKSVLQFVFGPILRWHRAKFISYLVPTIEQYRLDPLKKDSAVFRAAVDYVGGDGHKLSNREIGEVVICLLYVSSENTALGLTNALSDILAHEGYWERVKTATKKYLDVGDMKGLVACPLLDACVIESARMSNHIFSLQRRPRDLTATLGRYYVGDADSVAYCGPMMMVHDTATDVFSQPTEYNPDRFITGGERKTAPNIITWGYKKHLCPGKMFALYETKAALALILNHFDMSLVGKLQEPDYFSPSAFAERHLTVNMSLACDTETGMNVASGSEAAHPENEPLQSLVLETTRIEIYESADGVRGWHIRNYLDPEMAEDMYRRTVELSVGSPEHQEILTANPKTAFPITYDRLVYTGQSNCARPTVWYQKANEIWDLLYRHREVLQFTGDAEHEFNSLYCQLFGNEGAMAAHKDEMVNWGISVNLGASCDFLFDTQTVMLHSGDIFVSDFSRVTHAVLRVHENSAPGWFAAESCPTFGRTRCSIQIRNVGKFSEQLLSSEQFKDMVSGKIGG